MKSDNSTLATGPDDHLSPHLKLHHLRGRYPLDRLWPLWSTVTDDPLELFHAATSHLPRTTEAERLVVQRVGQDIFRQRLLEEWGGRCPLTGIADQALLRASHIIPWAECATDAERLHPENGLLLSALWDAAFDRGLVTFEADGVPRFSPLLSPAALASLLWHAPISLTPGRRGRVVSRKWWKFEGGVISG